jgi:3-oxoacyl-[acyl-carrier-protein] synthase II
VRIGETRGVRRLSPFTIPFFLSNLAAGQISIKHRFRGPLGCPVTACAASVQAIGDAMRMIRTGEADVVLAGGAEAAFDKVSLGGFAAARALSTGFSEEPVRASRPFDRDRDGFVMARAPPWWWSSRWIMPWRAAPGRSRKSSATAPRPTLIT